MKGRKLLFLAAMFITASLAAQLDVSYQKPPKEILDLADAPLPPLLRINSTGENTFLIYRKQFKSIAELSEKELRLAGLRINPANNISSRERFYYQIDILDVNSGKTTPVDGLPEEGKLSNFSWSPDEEKVAFTHANANSLDLWCFDFTTGKAKKLVDGAVNACLGTTFEWFKDSKALLVKLVPADKQALIDDSQVIPTGPIVSENDGQEAQNRTYQDLLKNKI